MPLEERRVLLHVRELVHAPFAPVRIVVDEPPDDVHHPLDEALVVEVVGVDRRAQHPGRGTAVAVDRRVDERPEEVRDVLESCAGARAVPVDDRDRDHVAEDEIRLCEIRMARTVLTSLALVRNRFGRQGEAVVRRREAVDVRQDLAAVVVDAEEARSAVESPLEVQQQIVDEVCICGQRPAHRVAHADDATHCDSTHQRHLGHYSDYVRVFAVQPIGVVRSPLREKRDAPNQPHAGAPEAVLEIDDAYADALHRIEVGDELIVLTWLHLADRDVLQCHPQDDERIPLTGVFRTRSSDRPNPIGVHRVTVTARERANALRVGALEAIDGTPIVDLKIALR